MTFVFLSYPFSTRSFLIFFARISLPARTTPASGYIVSVPPPFFTDFKWARRQSPMRRRRSSETQFYSPADLHSTEKARPASFSARAPHPSLPWGYDLRPPLFPREVGSGLLPSFHFFHDMTLPISWPFPHFSHLVGICSYHFKKYGSLRAEDGLDLPPRYSVFFSAFPSNTLSFILLGFFSQLCLPVI